MRKKWSVLQTIYDGFIFEAIFSFLVIFQLFMFVAEIKK